jgi:hypothetical protein
VLARIQQEDATFDVKAHSKPGRVFVQAPVTTSSEVKAFIKSLQSDQTIRITRRLDFKASAAVELEMEIDELLRSFQTDPMQVCDSNNKRMPPMENSSTTMVRSREMSFLVN